MFKVLWELITGYLVNKQSVSSAVGSGTIITAFILGLQGEVKRLDGKIDVKTSSLAKEARDIKAGVLIYVDDKDKAVNSELKRISQSFIEFATILNRIDKKVDKIEERQYQQRR